MAQARVKATGEIVDLAPGSNNGKFAMKDSRTGVFYDWEELERVVVKMGSDKISVSAVNVKVGTTVTGVIETNTEVEDD